MNHHLCERYLEKAVGYALVTLLVIAAVVAGVLISTLALASDALSGAK